MRLKLTWLTSGAAILAIRVGGATEGRVRCFVKAVPPIRTASIPHFVQSIVASVCTSQGMLMSTRGGTEPEGEEHTDSQGNGRGRFLLN